MSQASQPFAVQANPRHRGWRCLRCDARFERRDLFTGCPRCAADGHASNVTGDYGAAPPLEADPHASGIYRWGAALPYLGGVTLGEANTPLVALPRLAQALQLSSLELKNEAGNPTGSHKDRMSALAISRALETEAKRVVLASSGNAGVSAACYAAAAGLPCDVATFQGVAPATEQILRATGARVFQFATGMERWKFVQQQVRSPGVYPLTNYVVPAVGSQPFGVEGYRTIAYELHAQCAPMPQHIVVPCARGDLLSGLANGLRVLQTAGRIDRLPRLWAVEPFARLSAALDGADYRSTFDGQTAQLSIGGHTITWQALQALHVSAGGAVVVDDTAAWQAWHELGENGWPAELCAAAPLAAVRQLMQRGEIVAGSHVLMVLTARADRDSTLSDATPRIDTKGHPWPIRA
jgi:threonine synthase